MGKFKEENGKTRFGMFLQKASKAVPDVIEAGAMLASGNIGGAIAHVSDALSRSSSNQSHDLSQEFELKKAEFAVEEYRLMIQDRDSARNREIEIAKTGRIDFLMYVVAIVVLALSCCVVYAVFFLDIKNKDLAHFIAGEIITLFSGLVAYYFASTMSSRQKTSLLKQG